MNTTATYYKALSKIIGCCLFFLAALNAHAQTRGTVEVIKDPRIDTLAARRLEAAKMGSPAGVTTITTNGYRVQFYSGASRAEAYDAQAKFVNKYPDIHTYINYREPNFQVRAGDFRTRLEAAKQMQDMRPVFPVLFIISDKINPLAQ